MRECEHGQATVELALALPLVLVIGLLVVQLALIARDQVLVVHAARVAAREASVVGRSGAGHAAVVRSVPLLKQTRMTTETSYKGGSPSLVIVKVSYSSPTDVPVIGLLLPDVVLEAKAAMRDESVQTPSR
jgi:Flp pilus assembly protein TadG